MSLTRGREKHFTWSRKDEEYIADFTLISRRILDEEEYRLFKFHFLYGADWKLCCRQFSLNRGNFFHATYRIQQKLGRVFYELEPYGLFPLDEYFNSTSGNATPIDVSRARGEATPVRPPLQLAA
jgi:hypothetical protein